MNRMRILAGALVAAVVTGCSQPLVFPWTRPTPSPSPTAAVPTPPPFDRDEAYAKGRRVAEADIGRRKRVVRTHGCPSPWAEDYAKRLRRRHGIEVVSVGGCDPSPEAVVEATGYNEVMGAQIERQFGKGMLEKVAASVEADYRRRHPDPTATPEPPSPSPLISTTPGG
jgi:hypothetical protein